MDGSDSESSSASNGRSVLLDDSEDDLLMNIDNDMPQDQGSNDGDEEPERVMNSPVFSSSDDEDDAKGPLAPAAPLKPQDELKLIEEQVRDRLAVLRADANRALMNNLPNKHELLVAYREFKAEVEQLDMPLNNAVGADPQARAQNKSLVKTIKNLPKLSDAVAKNLSCLNLMSHLDGLDYALAAAGITNNVAAFKANLIASASNCRPLCRHVLSISSNLNMKTFRDKVLEFHGSSNATTILMEQLKELRQGSNDSIATFTDSFLTIIRALGSSEADPQVQSRYLDGLHNASTRQAVRRHLALNATMPAGFRHVTSTIAELQQLAMAVESGDSTSNTSAASPGTASSVQSVTSSRKKATGAGSGTREEPQWCYHHHSDSHKTSDCRYLGKRGRDERAMPRAGYGNANSSSNSEVASAPNAPSASTASSSSSAAASNIIRRCFHCNAVGHLRNACPELKNGKRPRTTGPSESKQ